MKSSLRRSGASIFAAALSTLLLCAGPAEEHNFVNEDLTWHTPDPLPPGQYRDSITLIDSKSIARRGEAVAFDVLNIWPATTRPNLGRKIAHYEASCGWRTIRLIPQSDATSDYYTDWLRAASWENRIVDAACAGAPVAAAQGAKNIEEAVAFWQGHVGLPTNTITVQHMISGLAPWTGDGREHGFVLLPVADETGNMLFLDQKSISRTVDKSSAEFLVVLGERAQRSRSSPVSIQRAVYDCTAETMTVVATDVLTLHGTLALHDERPFALRHASESPIIAANIRGVCGNSMPTGQAFHSVNEAWIYERSTWTPIAKPN